MIAGRSGRYATISEAFFGEIPEKAVISLVGGGGKTTLLFSWAKELASTGRRTVVTTTAHMFRPDAAPEGQRPPFPWDMEEDRQRVSGILDTDRAVMAVRPDPEHPKKSVGPSPRMWQFLRKEADILLVEADGSRRMPVKWPAPWEPPVPPESDLTVCVCGLSCLGRRILETAYLPEELAAAVGKCPEDVLEPEDLVRILCHPDGGRKHAAGDYFVCLNQADSPERQSAAAGILESLARNGVKGVYSCLLWNGRGFGDPARSL